MPPRFEFKPYTTHYEPQNAYWLARTAQLAYTKKSEQDESPDTDLILAELKNWDNSFTEVHGFSNKSSQAIIAKNDGDDKDSDPGYILIAFRGTDEPADWLDNINLWSVDFPRSEKSSAAKKTLGKIHLGFYQGFLDIWPEMDAVLSSPEYKKRPFWLTGHSLGGALATVASLQFSLEDRPFYGVYTFGQPRVCDRDLMRHFNAEKQKLFFRFQNNNDIVTRIPNRLAGYSHVGTYIYISTEQELSTDLHWWYTFADRVEGVAESIINLRGELIQDHMMPHYIEALDRNINVIPRGL